MIKLSKIVFTQETAGYYLNHYVSKNKMVVWKEIVPPLIGQPVVIIPTLLAPQQGMTCPCRLERCRIRTWDCRFYSLEHYHSTTTSPDGDVVAYSKTALG